MTTAHIRILAIAIACMLCAALADSASAAPQASTVYYAFCFTGTSQPAAGGPSVRYLSGIFLIDTAPYYAETHRSSLDQSAPFVFPWVRQFDQFIAQTHPRAGGSDCQGFKTMEEAQKKIDGALLGDHNNKIQDVETGWKYVTNPPIAPPPPASQPVAAAPVAAAPVQHWTVCWVQGNSIMTDRGARGTVYVSGVVPTGPPHDLEMGKAFGQFIKNKFLPQGLHSDAQCVTMPSLAATQAVAGPGGNNVDCSRWNTQCVMTDWTYTPGPNAAAVAAAPPPVNPCNSVVDHDLTKRPPGCGPTHVSYVVCSANDASPAAYISATFQVTALDNAGWTNGFAQLLAQKYSYKGGGVGCANIDETSAQTYAKNRVGALRSGGKTVVETGWAFGSSAVLPVVIPAAAAPPAPAPAPAAATQPSTLYAVCWNRTGGINTSAYFGVPFATTTREIPLWTAAFKAFLNEKYGRASAGTVSCSVSPTLDAAQRYEQKWRGLSSRNGKTIETGWSYGSSPAASAASATAAASTPAAPVVPSAQNTKYAVCWAEVPAHRTAYFSAPFTVAANFEAARTEYRKFLAAKYGQVGQFNCRVLSSLAEAQQQTQTWMNAARAKDTIVETGWKYE